MKEKIIPQDMVAGTIHKTNNHGCIEVIEYVKSSFVRIKFLNTHYETTVSAGHIRDGKIRNKLLPNVYGVGYLGEGQYKGAKALEAYNCWARMIRRCYSDLSLKKYPSYKGCTVCSDWHDFQIFAKWFYDNHPKDGKPYELDKDIKFKGNRVYSPNTCLFVTHKENSIVANAKNHKLRSPDGKVVNIYNIKEFCRGTVLNHRHMCEISNGKRKSHKGWKAA
jgi:hypothetical protein